MAILYGNTLYIPPAAQGQYYMTFSSNGGDFSIATANSAKNWNGTLEYSNDANTWSVWNGTSALQSSSGLLYLRGRGNTKITGINANRTHRWTITPDAQNTVSITGSVRYLLDWKASAHGQFPTMAEECFAQMFYGCTSIISAQGLFDPYVDATRRCFYEMFAGCTGLVSAPALNPGTELAESCCESMFAGCTGLASAPTLSAYRISVNCYRSMFLGCTSLTTAPDLTATSLAAGCYSRMFEGCTQLTSAPQLPADELAYGCYTQMFKDCTSLYKTPRLLAKTLEGECYSGMFEGCTSLAFLSELPATTLAESCYSYMFVDCINLTALPELPATYLEHSCYDGMFDGCTGIRISEFQDGEYQYEYRIPNKGDGIEGGLTMTGMFENTGGYFTGTPVINTTYYTDNKPVAP